VANIRSVYRFPQSIHLFPRNLEGGEGGAALHAGEALDGVQFARTLDETAELAVHLAGLALTERTFESLETPSPQSPITNHQSQFLRGLFSGGTLAYEALLLLQDDLPSVYSNAPLKDGPKLANSLRSQGHTIVDLGEDEFTVGRLHPMLDNDLRIRRLREEAEDPETGVILFDVVLGDGAHPDPASELAPAVAEARSIAQASGRDLVFVAVVVGTDLDPQDMTRQIEQLRAVGVHVFTRNDEAVRAVGEMLKAKGKSQSAKVDESLPSQFATRNSQTLLPPVVLSTISNPLSAINVGLESFTESLSAQGASVVQVDWRPPAGGNERLMGLLARMKKTTDAAAEDSGRLTTG
jgi:FdrA protein